MNMYQLSFTYCVVGDMGVGVNELAKNWQFKNQQTSLSSNLGAVVSNVTFKLTAVKNDIMINLVSLSGDMKHFVKSRKAFLKEADVVILCYSMTNKESLKNVEKVWLQEVESCKEEMKSKVPLVLCGTELNNHQRNEAEERREGDGNGNGVHLEDIEKICIANKLKLSFCLSTGNVKAVAKFFHTVTAVLLHHRDHVVREFQDELKSLCKAHEKAKPNGDQQEREKEQKQKKKNRNASPQSLCKAPPTKDWIFFPNMNLNENKNDEL